jgi:hypothetical protein
MLCEVSWAIAHKLLVIIYALLKRRSNYNELCFEERRAAVGEKSVAS